MSRLATARAEAVHPAVHDIRTIDPLDLAHYGGKAAGLARMHRLGLPVPPAFVIDTGACAEYQRLGRLPEDIRPAVAAALASLERRSGKVFADPADPADPADTAGTAVPLLVSVRSGAQISMPGMMDTVLNLGLDARSVLRLAAATGDPAFAVDTWMRFWSMYTDIVLDLDPDLLAQQVSSARTAAERTLDEDSAAALEQAVVAALDEEGAQVSTDPRVQLEAAIEAVFASWDSRRARLYREHHGISHDLGTAVTVQAMVFGNLGRPAGSGVAFTRDPKTGHRELFGEYLEGGQGEEVVAGTRTPGSITDPGPGWAPLVAELDAYGTRLETEYRDALDIEFTVEAGTLYLLQVRPAKRTAAAAVHIAADLMAEGVIDGADALGRVTVEQVKHLLEPQFDPVELQAARDAGRVVTVGIPASPGHGSGRVVLDSDRAAALAARGEPVVLIRPTTSPLDLRGMLAADAVVTARGGATSHAAVVSRALDTPCVVGCTALDVRPDERVVLVGDARIEEGQELSVDGATGELIRGSVARSVSTSELSSLAGLLDEAGRASGAQVWAKLDQPDPAAALRLPAPGVGVVSITDLLVASGGIDGLLAAIAAYGSDENAPSAAVEEPVEKLLYDVAHPLLAAVPADLPVHLRVPTMTSPRARSWIQQWTALAPRLLTPLGPRRLLAAYLRAVGAAAADTGRTAVTVLVGGITGARELADFAELSDAGPHLRVGAVLQNPVVLHRPEALVEQGHALWVDVPELVRTASGRPEELLYTAAELSDGGAGHRLPALLAEQLTTLLAAGGPDVGVEIAGHSGVEQVAELYAIGARRWSGAVGTAEELRLQLAQLALRGRVEGSGT